MAEIVIFEGGNRVFNEEQRRLYLYDDAGAINFIDAYPRSRVEPKLSYHQASNYVAIQGQYKWSANCSHLLFDVLADFVIGQQLYGRSQIIIKPTPLAKSVLSYLNAEILPGLNDVDVNQSNSTGSFDYLINPWRHSGMKHQYISDSLRRAFSGLMVNDGNSPKNIIINRRSKSSSYGFNFSRNINNIDSFVFDALESGVKFHVVDMEDYSFEDQVKLFYNAEKIISVHGSALVWLNFCRPQTHVFELITPYFYKDNFVKPDFWYISQNNFLNHISININASSILGDGMHPYDHDIILNWKYFKNLFSELNL